MTDGHATNIEQTSTPSVKSSGRGAIIKRMAWYFLIALILWALIIWFAQRTILFPRFLIPSLPPNAQPAAHVEVWQRPAAGGKVEAWFMPGDGVSAQNPGPAVIFAHGNGELIDFWQHDFQAYVDMGVSVLLPEFRGYGRSAGSPSQQAIVADFTAWYDVLAQRPEVDAQQIVLHGRSIGGGVIAGVMQNRQAKAVILQSTFTGAADMARWYLVPRILMRDPFDVLPVVQQYEGPLLILHGSKDQIIPPAHAHRLHEAASQSQLIFYPSGHNDPPPTQRYWQDIRAFLEQAGIVQSQ